MPSICLLHNGTTVIYFRIILRFWYLHSTIELFSLYAFLTCTITCTILNVILNLSIKFRANKHNELLAPFVMHCIWTIMDIVLYECIACNDQPDTMYVILWWCMAIKLFWIWTWKSDIWIWNLNTHTTIKWEPSPQTIYNKFHIYSQCRYQSRFVPYFIFVTNSGKYWERVVLPHSL